MAGSSPISNARQLASEDSRESLPFNRVVIARGKDKQLVYYWFEERGMKIANEYLSKLFLLRDAVLENRTDGALVRLTTAVYPGEAEADADNRLQEFMRIAVPSLEPYLPAAAIHPIGSIAPAREMIMRLFKNPLARTLTLCVCLGATLVLAGCGSREERAQAYYENGMSYLEKKDYAKARIEFRNAIQRKADLLPAWQALAQIDEQEQNIPALAGTLRRITELAPDDLAAITKLARIYLLGGANALDQALKLANRAGEIDPKNADVLALKAAILFKLKDTDGAMPHGAGRAGDRPGQCRRQCHCGRA